MSIFTKAKRNDLFSCNPVSVKVDSKASPSFQKEVLRSQESDLLVRSVNVKVDSKGRISIPSFLRKNFNLSSGDFLSLVFDLKKNFFVVSNDPKLAINGCESIVPIVNREPVDDKRRVGYGRN